MATSRINDARAPEDRGDTQVAPVKKPDPDDPSKKILDYVEPAGKSLLSNAGKFLEMLQEFDKDNIPDKARSRRPCRVWGRSDAVDAVPPQVIKKVGPYIENPDFTPKMIEKASVACKAICMWSDAASSVTLNLTSGRWRLRETTVSRRRPCHAGRTRCTRTTSWRSASRPKKLN